MKPSPKLCLLLLTIAIVSGGLLFPSSAYGVPSGLDLHSAAGYGIIDLNDNGVFNMNSGPVTGGASGGFGGANNAGSVVIGGTNFSTSGGNTGQITGNLYYDSNSTGNFGSGLQTPVTAAQQIQTTTGQTNQMMADIMSVHNYITGLAPTVAFSANIVGSGGINVINVANIMNQAFTLTGGANDYFVFQISGAINTNRLMTLNGVDAAHIFFDLSGSGTVLQTSGGNRIYGTFIATNGGHFQFSELDLTGSLINVNGTGIQYVSGSRQTTPPNQQTVPDSGSSLLLLSIGLGMGALAGRKLLKPALAGR